MSDNPALEAATREVIAKYEAAAKRSARRFDAKMAEHDRAPMVELFDWVARVVVRFQAENTCFTQDELGEALRAILEGQEPPDLGEPLPPEQIASDAFAVAILFEQPPVWLLRGFRDRSWPSLERASERLLAPQGNHPVGFQDVPGAVEALQSLVQSSAFPIHRNESGAS